MATRTGTVVGTPHYMAPEQALGKGVDHRCDVYSLGIVAYEMFFGRTPFTGDSPVAVLLKHVNEPLPVPAASRLPEPLLRAIQKATAKDPLERWPSAGAFAEALDTSLRVARISPAVVDRSTEEQTHPRSESRPGRLTIAAAALLGTAALAWVLIMSMSKGPAEPIPANGVGEPTIAQTPEPQPSSDLGIAEPKPTGPRPTAPKPRPPQPDPIVTVPVSPIDVSPQYGAGPTPVGAESTSEPEAQSALQKAEPRTADIDDKRREPGVATPAPQAPPAADVVVSPRRTRTVDATYPEVARAAQLEGSVVLDVTVNADGTVENVVVVKSPHTVLDDAARKAVMQYRYSPGRRNGVPEAMHVQETVLFQLR